MAFTLDTYAHALPGMQAQAAETLADAIFGAPDDGHDQDDETAEDDRGEADEPNEENEPNEAAANDGNPSAV